MSGEWVLWLKTQCPHRKGFTRATSYQPSDDHAVIWKPEAQNSQSRWQSNKDSDVANVSTRFGKDHSLRSKSVEKNHIGKRVLF